MDTGREERSSVAPLTRRDFVKSAGIGGMGMLAATPLLGSRGEEKDLPGAITQELTDSLPPLAPGDRAVVNTSDSPHASVSGIDMQDVKWTDGFWGDRFDVARESMVPHVGDMYLDPEIGHAIQNFEIAAGLREGDHEGPSFQDGDFYKWLEGAAALYAVTRDPSLDRRMDEIIDVIARAQRDDGYLFTPVLIAHRNGRTDRQPLQTSFETYTMGHLMTAAAVHYRATGKRSLLDVALKLTNYLYNVYTSNPRTLANNRLCPSHYMGAVELYRTTGDPKVLELARGLIDIRPMVEDGDDQNQDRVPFREQTEVVGHAVRGTFLYAAAADLYAETGDETLLEPLEKIWQDLVQRKLYVTGASGALYDGASPSGTEYDPSDVHKVHQAWGRPFQLPHVTAHNETCANVGNVLWAWRMFQIRPEAQYMDVAELALYNSVLSGVSLDGKRFLYTNPLRVDKRYPEALRWGHERVDYISKSNCCSPNVVRTFTEASSYAYGLSGRGLWINLYGSSELATTLEDGAEIRLEQQTDYPWDGNVRLELERVPAGEFSFFFRIPGWVDEARLTVNGTALDTNLTPGQYAEVRRRWSPGDRIELELPMRVKLVQAHPLVEEARNQVAVKRGPVVYCLESVDFPEGRSIFDVTIPSGIQFSEEEALIAAHRVVRLTGTAQLAESGQWDGTLYREVSFRSEPVQVRLIPYYAWGNRGDSEMTVWLPFRLA